MILGIGNLGCSAGLTQVTVVTSASLLLGWAWAVSWGDWHDWAVYLSSSRRAAWGLGSSRWHRTLRKPQCTKLFELPFMSHFLMYHLLKQVIEDSSNSMSVTTNGHKQKGRGENCDYFLWSATQYAYGRAEGELKSLQAFLLGQECLGRIAGSFRVWVYCDLCSRGGKNDCLLVQLGRSNG